jgi:hypothetical protein
MPLQHQVIGVSERFQVERAIRGPFGHVRSLTPIESAGRPRIGASRDVQVESVRSE